MKPRSRAKTGGAGKAKPEAAARPNKRATAQTRKLLGKHYANKYRTRRG